MRKLAVLILVSLVALSAISAKGEAESQVTEPGKLQVALLLSGRKDDVSFNQSIYEGLVNYVSNNPGKISLQVVENVYNVADIEPALIDFASEGYDVIFGHGFQYMEPVISIAPRYPGTVFLVATAYKAVKNSGIYDIALEYGGYLMGVIAARTTESGKVGLIGGAASADTLRGHAGFKAGVASVDPSIKIQEVYTGDWNDTAGAYEAAVGMYDSGVDIIWHSGDGIGLGAVQAAKDRDKYVLGNVEDQRVLAPENVLSGIKYNWEVLVDEMLKDIESGRFFTLGLGEKVYRITIPNGGIIYTPVNDTKGMLDEEDIEYFETVFQDIKQGRIDLSYLAEVAEEV